MNKLSQATPHTPSEDGSDRLAVNVAHDPSMIDVRALTPDNKIPFPDNAFVNLDILILLKYSVNEPGAFRTCRRYVRSAGGEDKSVAVVPAGRRPEFADTDSRDYVAPVPSGEGYHTGCGVNVDRVRDRVT